MKKIVQFLCLFATLLTLPAFSTEEKLVLITGCSRSGTMYISKLLTECHLDVGHEWTGNDGLSSWLFAVNAEIAPWGTEPGSVTFKHTFHQVRDPLKVISSVFTHEPQESWEYIISNIPEISWEDSRLTKAAKFWYYWNLSAQAKSEWTYRVEDIAAALPEMGRRLGIDLDNSAIERVPTNSNTRGNYYYPDEFKWTDLEAELTPELYENIRELARFYGYE